MNRQKNIGQHLVESFKTVAGCAQFSDYLIKIPSPANEPAGQANDSSIFRTTDK